MAHLLLSIILYITNGQSPSKPSTILPTISIPSSSPTFIKLPFEAVNGAASIIKFEMIVANKVVAAAATGDIVYFDYVQSFGSNITIRMTFNYDSSTSANLYCPYCIRQLLLGVENSHVNNSCYSAPANTVANELTLSVSYTHDDTMRHISTGSYLMYGYDDLLNIIPNNQIGFLHPITAAPSIPSIAPTKAPSFTPTQPPTGSPSINTLNPSLSTTNVPSVAPTNIPTKAPFVPTTINGAKVFVIVVCSCLCSIILISLFIIGAISKKTEKKSIKQEIKILEVSTMNNNDVKIAERNNENRKGENSISLPPAGRDKKDVKVVKQEEEHNIINEEDDIRNNIMVTDRNNDDLLQENDGQILQ